MKSIGAKAEAERKRGNEKKQNVIVSEACKGPNKTNSKIGDDKSWKVQNRLQKTVKMLFLYFCIRFFFHFRKLFFK